MTKIDYKIKYSPYSIRRNFLRTKKKTKTIDKKKPSKTSKLLRSTNKFQDHFNRINLISTKLY